MTKAPPGARVLTGNKTYVARYGTLSFRLSAFMQLDGTTGRENARIESAFGAVEDSIDARRIRLASHGRLGNHKFLMAADLGADAGLRDFWFEGIDGGLALYNTHLGKLRFGQMREPFGFGTQTSFGLTGFLERSLPSQTFDLGRSLGIMVHDVAESGRVHWSVGSFSLGSTDEDIGSRSVFSLTGRVSGLPIDSGDGRALLHVGGSVSSRNPTGKTRYVSRPEARFVDPYADTGDINASGINLFGLEVAGVYKSLWMQAELVHVSLESPESGNPEFDGGYAQLGWFVTGESRPYRRSGGVFDRFRPGLEDEQETRFNGRLVGGAWEAVGRMSTVDLNGAQIQGGELLNLSAGLNWYASEAVRVQLNYIHADRKDAGSADISLLRLQYHPW